MRLLALRLRPYGAFLEGATSFDPSKRVHVVYGENEGGKSTRRDAIEDLFFQIPMRSPYGFLAPLPTLRLEATLDVEGVTRNIVRLKKNKDSLIDEAEKPLSEEVLKAWLGGLDRVSYRQRLVFSRDQLREGGELILSAQGDVAASLYGAAFAGGDPREIVKRLEVRMTELFLPAPQAKKPLNVAITEFGRRTTEAKATVVSPDVYKNYVKQRTDIEKEIAALQHEAARVTEEHARFSRIAGAIEQHVRFCAERTRFSALLEGVQLSRAEIDQVVAHLAALGTAEEGTEQAARELERIREERQPVVDERLLEREPLILAAFARLAVVRRGLDDISTNKLDRRLEDSAETIATIGRELWPSRATEEARDERPAREHVERLQTVANEYGALAANQSNAETALVAQREERERLERGLAGTSAPPDLTALSAVLAVAKKLGDVAARIGELENQAALLGAEREASCSTLPFLNGDVTSVRPEHVPSREELEELRTRFRHSEEELRDATKAREEAEAEVRRLEDEMRSEQVRTAIELTDEMKVTRRRRSTSFDQIDEGWREQRPYDAALLSDYRASAEIADEIADERFDDAARFALADRLREEHARASRRRDDADAVLERLRSERSAFEADWTRRWTEAGLAASGDVAAMMAWLGKYEEIRAQDIALDQGQRERAQLRERSERAAEAIRAELRRAALDEPADRERDVATMTARAEEIVKRVTGDARKARRPAAAPSRARRRPRAANADGRGGECGTRRLARTLE